MTDYAIVGGDKWAAQQNDRQNKFGIKPLPELEGCPKPRPPTDQEAKDNLAEYIKSAGIKSCATSHKDTQSNWEASFKGVAISPPMYVSGGASGSSKTVETASDGCEAVVASAQSYYDASQKLKCMLNQNITNTDMHSAMNQEIILNVNGNVNGSTIDQMNKLRQKMAVYSQLNEDQKTVVLDDIKKITEDRRKMFLDSQTEGGVPTQGAKIISSKSATDNSTEVSSKLDQSVTSVAQTATGGQKITLNINGELMASKINQNNDLSLDAIVSNILSEVNATSMQSTSTAMNTYNDEIIAKTTAAGVPLLKRVSSFLGSIPGWVYFIVVVIIAYSYRKELGLQKLFNGEEEEAGEPNGGDGGLRPERQTPNRKQGGVAKSLVGRPPPNKTYRAAKGKK